MKKVRTKWTDFCPINPTEKVVKNKKKESKKYACRKKGRKDVYER